MKKTLTLPDPEAPPELQAAEIVLAILKRVGVKTWDDFENVRTHPDKHPKESRKWDDCHVPEKAWDMIHAHPWVTLFISTNPSHTLGVCDTCGEWLVLVGTVSKCSLSRQCRTGKAGSIMKTTQLKWDTSSA